MLGGSDAGQLDLFEAAALDDSMQPRTGGAELVSDLSSYRMGAHHERAREVTGDRKSGGVYYTPPDVVEHLLGLALDPLLDACGDDIGRIGALRVLDPACGSGNFLSAAGNRIRQRLQALGLPRFEAAAVAYGECLVGIDIDPTAVDICVTSLLHATEGVVSADALRRKVLCADALELVMEEDGLFSDCFWRALQEQLGIVEGFDLVIGNPPFLSQLASETVRSDSYSARLREPLRSAVGALTDTAVLFLLAAVDVARSPGGVVCLIQPLSTLSTRDVGAARQTVLGQCAMRSAWICEDEIFDASIRVWAPVLIRGLQCEEVRILHNRAFDPVGVLAPAALQATTWSALLAATKGVPSRVLRERGTVRDVASATADFRDQYYGLRGCVVDLEHADDTELPPLITSGLLDPAEVCWGSRATKFDKKSYQFPRVDIGLLEPRLQEWAHGRLRPKLMLATQTKVLEAFVDDGGVYLPSVPVLTVTADDVEELWRLGALLSSPPVTLVAATRHFGAALSSEALKLSASDVLDLPLPVELEAWAQAAEHFKCASVVSRPEARSTELHASATLMCEAFGLTGDIELMEWWSGRLPRRRTVR